MNQIDIIHTNDFHNHLSPALLSQIRALRLEYPDSLLLDAGDAISAGNIGVRVGGEPILREMSEVGYDGMTLGNREFHVIDRILRMKIRDASFPVLCCNMHWKEDTGDELPVVPHFVKSVNGTTVGVIGATVPMVTNRMAARSLSAYLFDDPVPAIQRQIVALESQCDLIIALTHIGLRDDMRLAESCPNLTAIIGGHSHAVLEEPRIVNSVPIFQGGWYGHYIGHVVVTGEPGKTVVTGGLKKMED